MEDDGTPDGLPPLVGGTAIRDWIEQKVPHLLDYPLSDFRVHTVVKRDPSRIPAGREVIVIDVGDTRKYIIAAREGDQNVLPISIWSCSANA